THGEDILRRARVVPDLSQAVADCVLVAATSARTGGLFRRQSVGPPEEVIPRLVEETSRSPVALVFGTEATGLTNEEITRCHFLIHIPTNPDYPTLNLAQAVTICLYELRRAFLKQSETPIPSTMPAPMEMQELMFAGLRA